MDEQFLCVGGPLHGKWRAAPPGVDSFRVAILPEPPVTPFSAANAAAPAKMPTADVRRYLLQEHPSRGLVWVFQE